MSALEGPIFTKVYSYTDCLCLENFQGTLWDGLYIWAIGDAHLAGVEKDNPWAIITPVSEGYRVELFREEE